MEFLDLKRFPRVFLSRRDKGRKIMKDYSKDMKMPAFRNRYATS